MRIRKCKSKRVLGWCLRASGSRCKFSSQWWLKLISSPFSRCWFTFGVQRGAGLVGQLTRLARLIPWMMRASDGSPRRLGPQVRRRQHAGPRCTLWPFLNDAKSANLPPVTINMTNANIFHGFSRITTRWNWWIFLSYFTRFTFHPLFP